MQLKPAKFTSVVIIAGTTMLARGADYSITPIGVGPTRTPAVAKGINASGQVTGFVTQNSNQSTIGAPIMYGFLYTQGITADIGSLGGGAGMGCGINAVGQIVGDSLLADGETSHAFLYSSGGMTDLGTLPGGFSSTGRAINSSGHVVGDSWIAGNYAFHAFLYSNGTMTDLGTLGGLLSSATGINDAGQIVGISDGTSGSHAFLYANGTMTDLGTLGGPISGAMAINNAGQIAGFASLDIYAHYLPGGVGVGMPATHAFLDSNDIMTDLGTLGGDNSEANALNSLGQVVGYSEIIPGKPEQHAFLYSGGTMIDLNSLIDPFSGWVLQDATGINDAGQITGNGTFDGEPAAFVLTPIVGQPINAIPEPATITILFGSIALLFGHGKRTFGR